MTPELEARFWSKVDASGDCWLWTGARLQEGYGHSYIGGNKAAPRYRVAHRTAYELLVGPIPDGHQLDHLCRNPPCVNPDHLEAVTGRVNLLRSPLGAGARARRTHCPQGHPYDEANTYISARNQRRCRICNREHKARAYAARCDERADPGLEDDDARS